jgi:hypothetical protein
MKELQPALILLALLSAVALTGVAAAWFFGLVP